MAVLAAENVSYTYQSKYQKVQALKNVSCTFEAGKFYAIIGQSGSGKTTVLSMLAFAEHEGAVPPLSTEWWIKVSRRYQ